MWRSEKQKAKEAVKAMTGAQAGNDSKLNIYLGKMMNKVAWV